MKNFTAFLLLLLSLTILLDLYGLTIIFELLTCADTAKVIIGVLGLALLLFLNNVFYKLFKKQLTK